MNLIKFIFYLVWQLIKPLVIILCVPLLLIIVILLFPFAWVFHHYEIYTGKRPSHVGIFAIKGIDYN